MKKYDIEKLDEREICAAKAHWDNIAKPLGSLGLLEQAIIKIAGITGNSDVQLDKRCAVILCADNGVVAEGVSQSESNVTAIVAKSIANGTSNINCMAHTFNADVFSVDMGMATTQADSGIQNCKISSGTNNIAEGAAMTILQTELAIEAGISLIREKKKLGYKIIVTGEMGIGNTTTASALTSVLLDKEPFLVTGKGAGLTDLALERKIEVISKAIDKNKPDKNKPVELLAKLGGYDIAGMVGMFLGGGIYHVPIVIDGFISAVAAMIAAAINPLAAEYMLASHVSNEPAGQAVLNKLGLKPLLHCEMRLGEGTGGILLLPLLDAALAIYHSAHKFEELNMEQYEDLSL